MSAPASRSRWQSSKLLVGLPDATPRMRFVDMQHLERAVTHQKWECAKDQDDEVSPFLVVFDIPPTTICDQIDSSALGETIKVQTCLDLPSNLLLLEVMKSEEHEAVSGSFGFFTQTKAQQMGLWLYPSSGATVGSGGYRKEPDASWKPFPAPGERPRKWPTVVLEVGWSESINKLAVDAQGWIEAKGSEVKSVITIKVDRMTPKMTIQKWEEAPNTRRITRSSHRTAEIKQEVIITHSNGRNTVTGTLEIQFEHMFGRPRKRSEPNQPQEWNLVFSHQELEFVAETAWRAQGFM